MSEVEQQARSGSLSSVAQKLRRAEAHLQELRQADAKFSLIEISMPFVRDEKKGIGFNIVKLPDPPEQVPVVVGDCLHNLRSSLDYLVWQAVLSGSKRQPGRSNMFPICQSEQEFAKQVKRGRLRGLPEAAVAVVKSLQPFDQQWHPLLLLDELYIQTSTGISM